MRQIYEAVLYQPLLNALIVLYQTVAFNDLGVAIIMLTILIRLVLFPVFQKSARHQAIMQKLQPKLKEIQETHRKDKEKQANAMMGLYREHGINPFSGFLLLLVQLPVLIALYHIFLSSLAPGFLTGLYGFVEAPAAIKTSFLGLIDLGKPSILMVGLAAIAQYFQGRLAVLAPEKGREPTQAEKIGRWMTVVGPLITLLIFYRLPAAVSLYWVVTSVFSIGQQSIINRTIAHGKLGTVRKTST